MSQAADKANTRASVDERLASAYRDLEGAVADAYGMALVTEVVTDVLKPLEDSSEFATFVGKPMKGYKRYLLTDEQASAFDFAQLQLTHMIRDLHRAYFEGFQKVGVE